MRTPGALAFSSPVRSLYIHVPFCSHKCHYCDFYSLVDTQNRQESFTQRLIQELHRLAPAAQGAPLETIFVGGGTPSLLEVRHWEDLLRALEQSFDLSQIRAGKGEFTVECNPESVTAPLLQALRWGGVDRISMGAQSFDRSSLKTLERLHNPESVPRALDLARNAGIHRLSIDLIFGVPGATLEDWMRDLHAALALGTEHLSCYNLTYEPNTAMTARMKRGEFVPADEDLEIEMYERTRTVLEDAGLVRYEVSNYARPGSEARHNLVYWEQGQWLAAGPSASGHIGGWRWKNAPRLDDYLRDSPDGLPPAVDVEAPDPARLLRERMWTGLRLTRGIESAAITTEAQELFPGARERLFRLCEKLAADELLEVAPDRWRLTPGGMLQADGIAVLFMEAVEG
ncbi:MAG: radical SAM family heme chaperone HemW [Phycisphaerales bacterium]|nr:radical SAM family heme chaperone HemW [Planctomycetota bacterium]